MDDVELLIARGAAPAPVCSSPDRRPSRSWRTWEPQTIRHRTLLDPLRRKLRSPLPTSALLLRPTCLRRHAPSDSYRKLTAPLVPALRALGRAPTTIAGIMNELHGTCAPPGPARPPWPKPSNQLRLLEATPLYGTDIRNSETAKDLPAGDCAHRHPVPIPSLRQGLLPRPGDRRAHPLPRKRPPHLRRPSVLSPATRPSPPAHPSPPQTPPAKRSARSPALPPSSRLPSGPIHPRPRLYLRREALDQRKKPLLLSGG